MSNGLKLVQSHLIYRFEILLQLFQLNIYSQSKHIRHPEKDAETLPKLIKPIKTLYKASTSYKHNVLKRLDV